MIAIRAIGRPSRSDAFALAVGLTYGAMLTALILVEATIGTAFTSPVLMVCFLAGWAAVLGRPIVRLERGTLNLTALCMQSAAVLLDPVSASVVGATIGLLVIRRGRPASLLQVFGCALMPMIPSAFRLALYPRSTPFLAVLLTVALTIFINLIITSINIAAIEGDGSVSVWRRNLTLVFWAPFAYFGLAAVVLVHLLDGSLTGYLYASIMLILSLALADTISGRRTRVFLENQLTVADRHMLFSRAVEGFVHNVRNHLAAIEGAMQDIDSVPDAEANRDGLTLVHEAVRDAISAVRDIGVGATPGVRIAVDPIDLADLARQAVALARHQAKQAGVELNVIQPDRRVLVRADPVMLRAVITNLEQLQAAEVGDCRVRRDG